MTSENRSTDPPVTSDRGVASRSTETGPVRRWIVQVVHDNPTFVSSLLYLYVTGAGILYSFILYRQFRINIFDYSEIGDFLLAGLDLREPRAACLAPGPRGSSRSKGVDGSPCGAYRTATSGP